VQRVGASLNLLFLLGISLALGFSVIAAGPF
jgi:hypothetical protein